MSKRKVGSSTKAAPSDFKRLKAKVGKAAPKAINYTDTTFQTAGLKLREQQLDVITQQQQQQQQVLSSSKGNSLETLLFQLNHHHAPAARISALKGIHDTLLGLLTNKTTTTSDEATAIITANLASLIPSLSKCAFVDTDSTVRSLGREILRIIFMNVVSSAALDPFLPLYIAYVSSACNSLFDDIRNDVTQGVLMATQFFSSSSSYITKSNATRRLLPSYARLLATSSSSSITNNTSTTTALKKKNNKKKMIHMNKAKDKPAIITTNNSKITSQRCQMLKSLAALLKWNTTTTTNTTQNKNFGSSSCVHESSDTFSNIIHATTSSTNNVIHYGANTANAILIININNDQHLDDDGRQTRRMSLQRNNSGSSSSSSFTNYKKLTHLFSHDFGNKDLSTTMATDKMEGLTNNKNNNNNNCMLAISEDSSTALLNSLLNCWVEVIQRGVSSSGSGTFLSFVYMEEVSYILSCLQEFWCKTIQQPSPDNNQCNKVSVAATNRIQTHLLEAFPIKDDSGNSKNIPLYNRLNASICYLLSEIIASSSTTVSTNSTKTTMTTTSTIVLERILAYTIPQFESVMENSTTKGGESGRQSNNHMNDNKSCNDDSDDDSTAMLQVVSLLLLKHEKTGNYLLLPKDRNILLKTFIVTFFPAADDDTTTTTKVLEQSSSNVSACSVVATVSTAIGRKAILLACEAILEEKNQLFVTHEEQHQVDSTTASTNTTTTALLLLRMTFVLPHLLKVLSNNYLFESSVVLMTLKSVTQRWYCLSLSTPPPPHLDGCTTNLDTTNIHCYSVYGFLACLRKEMFGILSTNNTETKKKKNRILSIFECYPPHMQRCVIGLIGFIKSPNENVTDALAQICARSCYSAALNESIVSYIFEVLFLIRKSIPMTSYLSFLIGSCGLGKKKLNMSSKSTAIDRERFHIFSFDFVTECTCRAINQSGCTVILPFLKPFLLSCLQQPSSDDSSNNTSLLFFIRSRVALLILSVCAEDLKNSHATASSIIFFIPEMTEIIGPLICDSLLPLLASTLVEEESSKHQQQHTKVMRPIASLLVNEPELTKSFVSEALSRFSAAPPALVCNNSSERLAAKRRMTKKEAECLKDFLLLNTEIFRIDQYKAQVDLLDDAIRSL